MTGLTSSCTTMAPAAAQGRYDPQSGSSAKRLPEANPKPFPGRRRWRAPFDRQGDDGDHTDHPMSPGPPLVTVGPARDRQSLSKVATLCLFVLSPTYCRARLRVQLHFSPIPSYGQPLPESSTSMFHNMLVARPSTSIPHISVSDAAQRNGWTNGIAGRSWLNRT